MGNSMMPFFCLCLVFVVLNQNLVSPTLPVTSA